MLTGRGLCERARVRGFDWRMAPPLRRGPVALRCWLRGLVWLLACEPTAPPVVAEAPAEVPVEVPVESPRGPVIVVDAAMVDHFPSLAHYPDFGMGMSEVLAGSSAGDSPAQGRGEPGGLSLADHARLGPQRVHRRAGAAPGFCDAGVGSIDSSQPMDRHVSGARGGFLEGGGDDAGARSRRLTSSIAAMWRRR